MMPVMTMMFRISIDSSRLLSNPSWRCSFPIETRRQTIGCAPWGHRVYSVQCHTKIHTHRKCTITQIHKCTTTQKVPNRELAPTHRLRSFVGRHPSHALSRSPPTLSGSPPAPSVPKAPLLCSPVHNPLSLPSTPYLVPLGQGRRIGGSARR